MQTSEELPVHPREQQGAGPHLILYTYPPLIYFILFIYLFIYLFCDLM